MLEQKLVKNMPPHSWMETAEVKKVMQVMNKPGKQTLFVGGCVRNALLGKPVHDIDLATQFTPNETVQALESAGIKAIPTGIEHGTVTAVINKSSFEITTLRKDVRTHGRHADVAFTDNWILDAERRDFTMNTLLADMDGSVYDPLGQGLADLEARKVIFVGDPEKRIKEDFLRILRFFRFSAIYGDGKLEEKALAACGKHAEQVGNLSKERITMEVIKILGAPFPSYILKKMSDINLLPGLFYKGLDFFDLGTYCRAEEGVLSNDAVGRLAFISCYEEAQLNVLHDFLILSNAQKKTFMAIARAFHEMKWDEDRLKKLVYKYGQTVCLRAVLGYALLKEKDHAGFIDLVQNFEPPVFPMNGDDVQLYTKASGKMIGDILAKTELWWLDEDMKPTRDECIGYMDKNFNNEV